MQCSFPSGNSSHSLICCPVANSVLSQFELRFGDQLVIQYVLSVTMYDNSINVQHYIFISTSIHSAKIINNEESLLHIKKLYAIATE